MSRSPRPGPGERRQRWLNRRLTWLLWLGLLLPLSQIAATAHVYGHLAAVQSGASGAAQTGAEQPRSDVHGGACTLCLQAASALLGGPPATPLATSAANLDGAGLQPTAGLSGARSPYRPYTARGPPLLLS